MAYQLLNLVRQAGRARAQLLSVAGVSGGLLTFSASQQDRETSSRFTLPGFTPIALADVRAEAQPSGGKPAAKVSTPSVALTGFEDVKDLNGFVSSALEKTLKYQKSSPLQTMVASQSDHLPGALPQTYGEQPRPLTMEPAKFYAELEKQPLSEKVMVLDDIVDSVIREAERSAEVSALTVGMVGGGVACYALLGWVGDLALPGVGTVACSAVAGATGHNRAKAAVKRTRIRFLTAVLDAPMEGRNTFVEYLSAPSLDVKQRIASETKPAIFFRDFYIAVQPLLKQVPGRSVDSAEALLGTAP